MIKILIRQASKPFQQPIDWGYSPNKHQQNKDQIQFKSYRDNFLFSLSIIKPKFRVRKNNYSLKTKGLISVEFIPLAQTNINSERKIPQFAEKYQSFISANEIYNILKESSVKLEHGKESAGDRYELLVDENPYGWEWRIIKNELAEDQKKIIFTKTESFYVKEYIQHAIPVVFGWNAIGNIKHCEMNLDENQDL